MAIEFSCSECGKHLQVRDGAAGRKFRCPNCGNVATVRDAGPPPMSTTRQGSDVAGANPDADGAAAVRQPNWTVRIVIGMLAAGAIVVACVAYYGYSSSHKKMAECDRLTRLVDQQVRIAEAKAERYDFGGAKDVLLAAATEVEESPYADVYRIDELNGKLAAARYDLERREAHHLDKIRAGWKLIDGRFVSLAEQQRALAKKKLREDEEAKRKAEERKLALAEKKRREEEKARRQEEERESGTRAGPELAVVKQKTLTIDDVPRAERYLIVLKAFSETNNGLFYHASTVVEKLHLKNTPYAMEVYASQHSAIGRFVKDEWRLTPEEWLAMLLGMTREADVDVKIGRFGILLANYCYLEQQGYKQVYVVVDGETVMTIK